MKVLFSSTSGHGHVIPDAPARPGLPGRRARRPVGHRRPGTAAGDRSRHRGGRCGGARRRGGRAPGSRADPGRRSCPVADRAAFVFPRMFGEALTPPMASRPGRPRPGLGPRPARPRARGAGRAPGRRRSSRVPSVTHSFGTAVPVAILDDTAAGSAGLWQRARPRRAAVRRLLPGRLPRHLSAVGADHVGRPHRAASSRSGRCRTPADARAGGTSRLRHPGHRPERSRPAARGGDGGRRVWRSRCWWLSDPGVEPARWGDSPRTCRWSRGSTRPPCSPGARPWSRTAAPAPSWAPWRAGCPSSACRRRPTSSATPRAGSGPAPPLVAATRGDHPAVGADRGRAAAAGPRAAGGAQRVAAEIAAMPGPDEVVRLLA